MSGLAGVRRRMRSTLRDAHPALRNEYTSEVATSNWEGQKQRRRYAVPFLHGSRKMVLSYCALERPVYRCSLELLDSLERTLRILAQHNRSCGPAERLSGLTVLWRKNSFQSPSATCIYAMNLESEFCGKIIFPRPTNLVSRIFSLLFTKADPLL